MTILVKMIGLCMDNKVFIDSSGFKAWLDEKDDFHLEAEMIVNKILDNDDMFVTSNSIVDECSTLLRVKCGLQKAMLFKKYLSNTEQTIKMVRVSVSDEIKAWKLFENEWSGLSFTDCTCFAMMKRLEIKRVFGFDKHFERAGFILEKKGQ